MAPPCQPPVRRSRGIANSLLALLAWSLACAQGSAPWGEDALARADLYENTLAATSAPASDSGELRVQLAFGGSADLDLYVTDPLQETVYFARRDTGSGGRLEADRRCPDPAPRVERVVYPAALPGRYRIGVDYHSACSADGEREAFVVQVDYRGVRQSRRREIEARHFEVIVWEFEIAPPAEER